MSRFNTLYLGEPDEAADILECDDNPVESLTEVRVALTNALRRIARLERELRKANEAINMTGKNP
jgi:hypothetical protein